MSKLLIDEEPLQVLPSLAARIGLNEAIFLQQLHYWLKKSKHEHDERKWIYNTFGEWQAQFPFWTERTLQRIVKNLVRMELVKVYKFNKSNWDRTNWYTIKYDNIDSIAEDSGIIKEIYSYQKRAIATNRRARSRQVVTIESGSLT
jgi:hypothetical protein